MTEKPEAEEHDSDSEEKSSSVEPIEKKNPLLLGSKSHVSTMFGKSIRNCMTEGPESTIKDVKATLATMTAPKKFVLE